jgi:hypothetical protein
LPSMSKNTPIIWIDYVQRERVTRGRHRRA